MKKVVLMMLAVICCCLLTGCADLGHDKGRTGDFYDYYTMEKMADGSYKVSAEAHMAKVLPLIYFNADQETALNLHFDEFSWTLNIQLVYVYENEQGVQERLILEHQAESDTLSANLDIELDLAAGESHLEWRTKNKGEGILFELLLSNKDGVNISMLSPIEDEKWQKMKEGLPELSPSLSGSSQGVSDRPLVLQAGEHFAFVYPSPKKEDTLGLLAWLAEPAGDLQLVYVQPDGADKLLWSSEGQDEWLVNLEIDLLPGGGRLEWRSENGCECTLNFLIEYSEEAGVIGFSA